VPDEVHGTVEVEILGDVLLDEAEVRVASEVLDIVGGAGDQVVDDDDTVAAGKEDIDEVGAEETGTTGDDGDGFCG
jgi:hypothetical protein